MPIKSHHIPSCPLLLWLRYGWVFIALGLFCMMAPKKSQAQVPRFAGCDVLTQIPEEECNALEIFFNKMDGLFWKIRGGWLIAGQPCEWTGVVCETGPWPRHIKKIVLIDNNVGGSIPGELSFLTQLEELVIENTATAGYFNVVGGFLPDGLADLPNLKVMKIRGHEIRGPIPADFANLKSLEVLDLSDNLLDGPVPAELGKIVNLREIDLSGNAFRGFIPPELGNLPNLEKLDLSFNDLIGPIPSNLGSLDSLRVLNLQSNTLTGGIPASLVDLENLVSLSVDDNNLAGPPPPEIIKLASGLSICTLAQQNPQFCIPDIPMYRFGGQAAVCDIPLQSSCSFCENNNGASVSGCNSLESLYYATDGLNWMQQSGWLSNSNICEWPGIGCTDDQITALELPGNNLSGRVPEELGTLSSLESLDLSGNDLQGELPFSVASLQNTANSCKLDNNNSSLCIPDDPAFKAISSESICGLPLAVRSCSVVAGIGTFTDVSISNSAAAYLGWRARVRVPDYQFDIEQKIDGVFLKIGSVSMPLSMEDPESYGFPLPALNEGVNTYRVRLTSGQNASDVYSEVVELVSFSSSHFLEPPYPNPAYGELTFRFAVQEPGQVLVSLFDVNGRLIRTLYEGRPEDDQMRSVSVETGGLSSGLYFIHMKGASFSSTTSVVIRR